MPRLRHILLTTWFLVSACFFAWVLWPRFPVEHKTSTFPIRNGQYYDPIEDDPAIGKIIEQAGREADEELKDVKKGMRLGYCHVHWQTMKRILKEKYGITWRSPEDLNPHIAFD